MYPQHFKTICNSSSPTLIVIQVDTIDRFADSCLLVVPKLVVGYLPIYTVDGDDIVLLWQIMLGQFDFCAAAAHTTTVSRAEQAQNTEDF